MEQEVQKWLEDATKKLSAAETLGAKANTLLTATKSTISSNNGKLIKSNFLLDSINQLVQILETIHDSVELRLNDRRQSVKALKNYLELSLTELRKEFDKLKQIKIDANLLSGDHRTLYDFVSNEVLETLLSKQDELEKSRESYVVVIEQQQEALKTKLNGFNKQFNQLEKDVTEVNDAGWISDLIDENNKLEEEVAGLLESLTNHYDQCSRGARIFDGEEPEISEVEKTELFEVLAKDFQEVPDVLNDLEECIEDIEQRCKKIDSYLSTKFYDIKLKHLVQDLTSFGENELMQVMSTLDKQTVDFQAVSTDINEKCDEAHQLINHYERFVESYYRLILELDRRQGVQLSMEKVFNEAKTKLQALQEDDYKKRDTFFQTNGSYLPNDLWEGLNDDRPLCNLKFEIHGLPEINSSTLATARKNIGK